jgi:hypothetical protein
MVSSPARALAPPAAEIGTMQEGEQRVSRRTFFLTILGVPAALAACSREPAGPPVADQGSPPPPAAQPRVKSDPPPRMFAALRRVPLDRDVEPFALEPPVPARRR